MFVYLDFQGRNRNLSGFIKKYLWDNMRENGQIIVIFWMKYPFKLNTQKCNVCHLLVHVSADFFHETQVDC